MYQTGSYWHFSGLGQVAAGLLPLIPVTATLGAIVLCWDYDRFRSLLFPPADRPPQAGAPMPGVERAGYAVGVVAGLLVFLAVRGLAPIGWVRYGLAAGALGTVMVLAAWVRLAAVASRRRT